MDEITGLFTKSDHPCDVEINQLLADFMRCPIGLQQTCAECIWERRSKINKKLLEKVDILLLED